MHGADDDDDQWNEETSNKQKHVVGSILEKIKIDELWIISSNKSIWLMYGITADIRCHTIFFRLMIKIKNKHGENNIWNILYY